MENVLQLNEFFVEGGRQFQSHVLLHIAEPSTEEERAKGYFFAICEVNQADNKYLLKLQDIIENIENGYYENSDGKDKNSLEIVLDKANQEGYALLKQGISISCVVGAIRPPEIFFSFYGEPMLLLFYQGKEGEYKKMDLAEGGQLATDKGDEHLFPQIIQGKITPHDYLFFGTKHIINYFDHDRLHKVITSRPPEQSARHIEKVLGDLQNGFSFGGMVIHLNEQRYAAPMAKPYSVDHLKNESTVNTLFVTEQKTEDTLSPSMLQRINKKIKGIFSGPSAAIPKKTALAEKITPTEVNAAHLRQHRATSIKTDPWGQKLLWILKSFFSLGQIIIQVILWMLLLVWTVLNWFFRSLGLLFLVITNFQDRRRNILQNWSRSWGETKTFFKNLPTVTKILLILSVIIITAIVSSMLYLRAKRTEEARTKLYVETLQEIKTKKDNAESALIYGNEEDARQQLEIARTLLNNLPCLTTEEKNNCQSLRENLEKIAIKIRRETAVTPGLLFDWNKDKTWKNAELLKIGNKLLAFGPATSSIFVYDLLTKESKKLENNVSSAGFSVGAAPKENDYAVLLFNKKELVRYDPEKNSLAKIEIFYDRDNVDIAGLSVYNRRLYSLDSANGQIYRHDAIKTGFGQGKDWLKTPMDLGNGTDLAIEGDVFVLKNSGEILKFMKGVKQPFAPSAVDPALISADKIWTYADLKYIYILDSANRRLLLLDKEGRLKTQITAEEFENPTGLAIDETKGSAYILDNGRLFEIKLPS